jgi:hypothetical protein
VTPAFSASENAMVGLSGFRMAHNHLPPVPRQQFVKPVRWMGGDACEDISGPGLRINAIHLSPNLCAQAELD